MKRILVTGLCTLHWGRLQYGNIGNYYIIEPLFQRLHKYFPEYEIVTTFQMDDIFVKKENISVLPMELYYSWRGKEDIESAIEDVCIANQYMKGVNISLTPYLKQVLECEYVIDVSGDMWGDNAEHVGHKRFLVNCLKMEAAQIMKKKTILFAVTPGAFSDITEKAIARKVFEAYDKVIIREKISKINLEKWGFSTENVQYAPCPSFLFEANKEYTSKWTKWIDACKEANQKVIGLTFGGFNMPIGPYDMWPRPASQYKVFKELAEYIIKKLHCKILLFSHTNGFELPPKFKLTSGRDYAILKQFYDILQTDYHEDVVIIDEPLLPCDIKTVIGKLDMLITGRVHASVASVSQCVPTVFMEYDRNVIYSDKMLGFSEQTGMQEYVCEPENTEQLIENVSKCFNQLDLIRERLHDSVNNIQNMADEIFGEIRKL